MSWISTAFSASKDAENEERMRPEDASRMMNGEPAFYEGKPRKF